MTILLIGATGRIGPHVARSLIDAGETVRVASRDPERARPLLPEQVEIQQVELDDISTVLGDVSAVLVLTEHGQNMAGQQLSLLAQIHDPTVRVVKISGTSAAIRPDGPDACRQHWRVEEAVKAGRNPWVIVRPNAFMQTLVAGVAPGVRSASSMNNPLGSAGISMIDSRDIGAVTARALVDEQLVGRTLVLTGPQAYTYQDIAGAIHAATGHSVRVTDVELSDVAQGVRARGGSDWDAEHLTEMLAIFRAGLSEYVTDDVPQVLGRAARSLDSYVRDHQVDFIPMSTDPEV